MAFWDQDAVVDQAPSSGGGWNQDPVVSQGASSGGWHQDPVVDPEEEERRRRQPPPEAEGMFATGLRSFAHEAPAVAAGAAGAMTGAGLGSAVAPGVGTVVGGLAGAVAGGFGGSAVAETGLKALGYDDSMQRAVNEKTNPWSSAIGSGLAQVLGFGAGAASTAARLGGAAIGGGIEAGSQLYQGEFDPAKLAAQTAAGAAFTNPYKWGTRLEQAGQRAGEEIGAGYRTRGAEKIVPEQHGSAGSKSDSYGSETATPPRKDADVGDAHQERSVGSERNYPNPTEPEIAANRPGINTTGRDPDIELAIKAKAGPEPPPTNAPVAEPSQGRPMGEQPTAAPEAPGPVDQATMGRAADEQVAANQAAAGTTEPIGREPTTVRADDPSVIPEAAIQRDVVERGRLSGRPIQTEPLPIGTEQQILERGAQRVEEGPRPGEVPPPEMQAARRQGAPAELPEGFTVRQTPGGRHILEQDGGFRGDFPTAAAAITDANRMAQLTTKALPSAGALKGERLTQAALDAGTTNVKEAGAALPPIGAETPLDTKVAEALAAPKPTKGEVLKAKQAAKAEAVKQQAVDVEAQVAKAQEMGSRPEVNAEAPAAGGPPKEPPGGQPPPEAPPPPEPAPKGPDRPKFLDEVVQRPKRLLEELQNVFAPHLRSEAAGSLRQRAIKEAGTTQSVADKAENLMSRHDATIEAMNPERRQQFKDWFETGGKGDFKPTEAEQKAASALKVVGTMWEGQIGRLGRAEGMDFIKNYLPHMYKNPEAAEKFVNDYAANIKGGGAGSLRKRFFETEAAARAAGHEPLSDNPFDLFRRYGESMKQFVAKEALREHVVDSGIGKYAAPPKVVGAAGSPEPQVKGNIPPGWVPSQTAPVKNGQQLYLPEDIVRVFDRFNGERGLAEKYPGLYGAAKAFNTGWNKVLLAISGYHFATMANEGMMSELTRAGQLIGAGKWGEAGSTAAGAWKSPYATPKLGGKVQEAYLNLNSAEAAKRLGLDGDVIDAMAKGGLRFVGSKHAPDLNMGENAKGSYIKAKGDWMGTIKSIPDQMSQGLKDAKSEWLDSKGNVPDATKYAFRQIGRVIDTTAEALFNVYIPKMKAGAAYKEVKQWKDLNPDISVHSEEGMKAVNKIISNIDDRFGEMATSRTFINKSVQDAATAGMTSYSWVLGSMKGIGGGIGAIGKAAGEGTYKFAKGDTAGAKEALSRISPTNKNFDPRIAYVPALMAQTALMSTFYQAIFGSHDAPEGWRDLYAPRTGGTIPGFGGRGQIPEHMLVPGFQKDIYGYAAHPLQEAYGKVGSGWKTIMEQLSNSDWRGYPIVRPNATALDAINDRATHITKQFGPLSAKNWTEGGPEGSRIPAPLRAAGFRATSKEFSDPERGQMLRTKRETKAWKLKTRTENREARERGRPEPYPAGQGA